MEESEWFRSSYCASFYFHEELNFSFKIFSSGLIFSIILFGVILFKVCHLYIDLQSTSRSNLLFRRWKHQIPFCYCLWVRTGCDFTGFPPRFYFLTIKNKNKFTNLKMGHTSEKAPEQQTNDVNKSSGNDYMTKWWWKTEKIQQTIYSRIILFIHGW